MAFSAPFQSVFGSMATAPSGQQQQQQQHHNPVLVYQQQQPQQQPQGPNQLQPQGQNQQTQTPQHHQHQSSLPQIPQFSFQTPQVPPPPPSQTLPAPSHPAGFGSPSASTPALASSPNNNNSNNALVMPNLPYRSTSAGTADSTKTPFPPPRVTRTLGQRPSCLVNATLTYCGDNQIYAFGGFDQYTDEVYNQVRRLDLVTHQWTLVDNYGDIPGVRMGHTATLYQGSKLLVFGGENEHRNYLADLIIFDTKTAHWTQPQLHGTPPTGRARHAAVVHDDKLFIMGGISGLSNYVLDDICYLDLRTFTWSRSWRFVPRFDHAAHIHDGRVWVFGGLDLDSNKAQDLWWMDIKNVSAFESSPPAGSSRQSRNPMRAMSRNTFTAAAAAMRQQQQQQQLQLQQPLPHHNHHSHHLHHQQQQQPYAANSGTAQISTPSFQLKGYSPQPPAPVSSLSFQPHSAVPSQVSGCHFHAYSTNLLLDFGTPSARTMNKDCSLYSFDLATFKWQQLAVGPELLKPGYKWHYITINEDRTKAWLLGCPDSDDELNHVDESLSDILEVDLRRYGILGSANGLEPPPTAANSQMPQFRGSEQVSKGLSADLSRLFDQSPDAGSGADFVITGSSCQDADVIDAGNFADAVSDAGWSTAESDSAESQPIHVHRIILQARWPHFTRLYNSQMREFHSKQMHIPEPYPIVRAFLHYLYTDSIHGPAPKGEDSALDLPRRADGAVRPHNSLAIVTGLLVMSNLYMMPHLRHLCVHRLSRELDVENACLVWYRAEMANEDWLRRRAANFCMQNWGRIVRTRAFANLPRHAIIELSQATGTGSRVFEEDEMEDYVRHQERDLDDEFMIGA